MERGLVGGCCLQNAASDNSLSVGNIIPSRWEQVSQALGTRFPTGWEFLSVQPADGFFLQLQINQSVTSSVPSGSESAEEVAL